MDDNKQFTRREAADYLGCTVSLLNKIAWIDASILPYSKVGRCSKYRKSDLDKYLASKTRGRDG